MKRIRSEGFAGSIEYLLSPDEKDPLLTQKGRRELREKFQSMFEQILKPEKENRSLKEEYRKLRDEYEEYRHRHPEPVEVKNGKSYAIHQNMEEDGRSGKEAGCTAKPQTAFQGDACP